MTNVFRPSDLTIIRKPWAQFTVSIILILLDQLSKKYFQESAGSFINQEGPFSFPLPLWITIFTSIVIIVLTLILLYKLDTPISMQQGFILLISGGASNLIDRLLYGYVQDIIAISSTRFNLADIYILAGVILILFGAYKNKSKPHSSDQM